MYVSIYVTSTSSGHHAKNDFEEIVVDSFLCYH